VGDERFPQNTDRQDSTISRVRADDYFQEEQDNQPSQTMRVFTAPLTTFIMTDETQMPVRKPILQQRQSVSKIEPNRDTVTEDVHPKVIYLNPAPGQ
jgi:hypothetical protein